MEKTSISERWNARVDHALAHLRKTYAEFEVVAETWRFSSDGYDWIVDRFEAGTVGGPGAWISGDAGAVQLLREDGADGWSEPGGKQEPEETLAETATREAREETGVTCAVTDVAVAKVIHIETPERPRIYRLLPIFLAEYRAGTPRPAEPDSREVRWWKPQPSTLRYDVVASLPIPADD